MGLPFISRLGGFEFRASETLTSGREVGLVEGGRDSGLGLLATASELQALHP